MEYKITGKISEGVITEILRIKEQKGLTAEEILAEAKNKDNPLHNLFDWKDSIAAEKWRMHQARLLINEVKVIIDETEYYAFENVNIVSVDNKSYREYKTRQEILSQAELRNQVISRAYKYLLYWRSQYKNYKEFQMVFESIDQIGKELDWIESREDE